jgi:hypothetical protein
MGLQKVRPYDNVVFRHGPLTDRPLHVAWDLVLDNDISNVHDPCIERSGRLDVAVTGIGSIRYHQKCSSILS